LDPGIAKLATAAIPVIPVQAGIQRLSLSRRRSDNRRNPFGANNQSLDDELDSPAFSSVGLTRVSVTSR
jgi:hypothetical protein